MKFNKVQKVVRMPTKEKGSGYKMNEKFEFVAIIATSQMKNKFYESETKEAYRLLELIDSLYRQGELIFMMKALIYCRTVLGIRSITQFAAAYLARYISGTQNGYKFYTKRDRVLKRGGIIFRIDDMMEILAAYIFINKNRKIPHSIKKGFAKAIRDADRFELSKYKLSRHSISLIDIVNLTHPKPSKKNGFVSVKTSFLKKILKTTKRKKFRIKRWIENSFLSKHVDIPALTALVYGKLKQHNTFENSLSKTGSKVSKIAKKKNLSEDEKDELLNIKKTSDWIDLISENKLGYFALLRNLRNIINTKNDELIQLTSKYLINKKLIKSPSNLIFPYNYEQAYEAVKESGNKKLMRAMTIAYDISCTNLLDNGFTGESAVVIDSSASMVKSRGRVKVQPNTNLGRARLFGATIAKGTDADIYQFGTTCREEMYNPSDSAFTIAENIIRYTGDVGHGTDFPNIFRTLKKRYNRIIIISDMQNGNRFRDAQNEFKKYKNKYNCDPYVYMVHIEGYNTRQLKQSNKVIELFGYGKHLFEIINNFELNLVSLIDEINEIKI